MTELFLFVCVVLLAMIWSRIGSAAATIAYQAAATTESVNRLDARLQELQQRLKDNNIMTDKEREAERDAEF